MDRVKAAIFSALADALPGARVLDLYAGSGALGIEALSRGAAAAIFVESDRHALDAIRRNLEKTRLQGHVIASDVSRYLTRRPASDALFDLILADPPYSKSPTAPDHATTLLATPALASALASGGTLILETASDFRLSAPPEWHLARTRVYGSTAVHFLLKVEG